MTHGALAASRARPSPLVVVAAATRRRLSSARRSRRASRARTPTRCGRRSSARTASSPPDATTRSSAGVRILQQGGNAVDAGVASVLAASVVRDLALRLRRRSADDDLRREDAGGHRHQRPGSGAEGGDAGAVRREGLRAGQRSARRDDPAMLDAMALALEAKGTMHLEQVLQPAIELADGFPMYEFLRNFFVSERKATEQWEWSKKTYYPERPRAGGRRDLPAAEPGAHAARDRRGRPGGVREDAQPRAGDSRRARRVLHGDIAHRIADADKAAGGVFTLRRSRVVPRQRSRSR